MFASHMITAPDNHRLKEIRRLAGRRWRDKLGRFVAEGEDLVQAASDAGWEPVDLLRSADAEDVPGDPVHPKLLGDVSALGSGTRVIGVYEQRWAPAPLARAVALWGVHDPGNVGTVLRGALAFGAGSVVIAPGSADPYGPKAVRASMGAIFAVPVCRVSDVAQLPAPRLALDARAPDELAAVAAGAASLVVGAERAGLPPEVLAACERTARIAIRSESLNAAMAATVALYETSRMEGSGAA